MFWVASATQRQLAAARPQGAPDVVELDVRMRHRLALAEVGLGSFLVLLSLRRGGHGTRLLLPFAALTLALVSALWLAPDVAALEREAHGTAAPRSFGWLWNAQWALDSARVLMLFLLLQAALRQARPR